jgi:hypothetical protein
MVVWLSLYTKNGRIQSCVYSRICIAISVSFVVWYQAEYSEKNSGLPTAKNDKQSERRTICFLMELET